METARLVLANDLGKLCEISGGSAEYHLFASKSIANIHFPTKSKLSLRCIQSLFTDGQSQKTRKLTIIVKKLEIMEESPRHWRWLTNIPNSSFKEARELNGDYLHVEGVIETEKLAITTKYGIFLVYKINSKESQNLEAIGKSIVEFEKQRHMEEHKQITLSINLNKGSRRNDGWFEYKLGQFELNQASSVVGNVRVTLLDGDHSKIKKGLIIAAIQVRVIFT